MSSSNAGDPAAADRAIDDERATSDRSAASFVRGLTLGALIGAIIAGSSIWSRRRRARLDRRPPA